MIEGAEILKKTELFDSEPSKLTIAIGIIAIILIIGIIIYALMSTRPVKMIASFFVMVIICFIGAHVLQLTYEDVPAGYQYDVYAEEAEVIKALYENYEIISANGNIYTVRDKVE